MCILNERPTNRNDFGKPEEPKEYFVWQSAEQSPETDRR